MVAKAVQDIAVDYPREAGMEMKINAPLTQQECYDLLELEAGSGPVVADRKRVKVAYVGRLTDGTVFDSNTKNGKTTPFTFTIGAG